MQQEKGTVIWILDSQDTHVSQTNKKLSQALQTTYNTCKQPYITNLIILTCLLIQIVKFFMFQIQKHHCINIMQLRGYEFCLINTNTLNEIEIQIITCLSDKYCVCIGKRKNNDVEIVRINHSFVYINRQKLIRLP